MGVLAFVLFIDLFAKLGVNFGIYATSCAMPQLNDMARGDPYADLLFCCPGRGVRAAGVSYRGYGGFRPEEGEEGENKSFWQRRGKLRTGSSRAIYADPLRLAKAGDSKKAPGPSCVLPHQVDVE